VAVVKVSEKRQCRRNATRESLRVLTGTSVPGYHMPPLRG